MDGQTEALLQKALKEGKIGSRQHGALARHAGKHTPEHVQHMLALMQHTTLRAAHKAAMAAVGR